MSRNSVSEKTIPGRSGHDNVSTNPVGACMLYRVGVSAFMVAPSGDCDAGRKRDRAAVEPGSYCGVAHDPQIGQRPDAAGDRRDSPGARSHLCEMDIADDVHPCLVADRIDADVDHYGALADVLGADQFG